MHSVLHSCSTSILFIMGILFIQVDTVQIMSIELFIKVFAVHMKIIHSVLFFVFTHSDSVVLASTAHLWSGGPCSLLAICDRDFQGSPPRFCSPGRHEWNAEVPDPQRRPIQGKATYSTYLVGLLFILFISFTHFHLVSTNWICRHMRPTTSFDLGCWLLCVNVQRALALPEVCVDVIPLTAIMWWHYCYYYYHWSSGVNGPIFLSCGILCILFV